MTITILVLFGVSGYSIYNYLKKPKKTKKEVVIEKKESLEKQVEEKIYKVDIKGEIISPGIYSLKKDSRIIDVIGEAGGLTDNADTSVINLSKKIVDEMVIIIYSKEQVQDFKKTKEIEKQVIEKCQKETEDSLSNDACITTNETITNSKISINNASLEELQSLPGIGSKKAQDIIDYRNQNGPFQAIEDLLKIPGIGDNLFAQIKENITL